MSWKVGEISRETGISVRTLHYYEQIGLLVPEGRSSSGHRLYSHDDIVRLQQIKSLQQLGMSLTEVGRCLEQEQFSGLEVMEELLVRCRQKVAEMQDLCSRLERLTSSLKRGREVPTDHFLETIQLVTTLEKYYTPEEAATIQARHGEMNPQHFEAFVRDVRGELERGTTPGSSRARSLARRWGQVLSDFAGRPEEHESFLELMKKEPDAAHGHGLDAEVLAYLTRIMEHKTKRRKK